MWFVYIIQCGDGSFYVGSSDNPERRFQEHKNGKGGRYTRLHKAEKLLYIESLPTQVLALKKEKQLKGWTRKKKESLIKLGYQKAKLAV